MSDEQHINPFLPNLTKEDKKYVDRILDEYQTYKAKLLRDEEERQEKIARQMELE